MTHLHYCLTMIMNYELVEELRWSFVKLFQDTKSLGNFLEN
jgi:hypothetical protein